MRWLYICTVFFATPVWANSSCKPKALLRKDCELKFKGHTVKLLKDTVAWNDGTWRAVDPMPLTQEGVKWERAKLEFINNRPILQLWLWDEGVGEAKVQSLHWYVYERSGQKLKALADGVVRKRRRLGEEPDSKFVYDSWKKHQLKALSGGALEWSLGNNRQILDGDKHGL